MELPPLVRLTAAERRRSLRRITICTAIWTLGSALAAGLIMLYFGMQQFNTVSFREVVLLVAAIAGLLRLIAPFLMRRRDSVRQVAIIGMACAAILMAVLPSIYRNGSFMVEESAICVHVALFVLAVVCEAIAGVAIWLWIGQLCPRRLLGKYLGRKEAWRALAASLGVAAVIAVNWYVRDPNESQLERLAKFMPCIWLGAVCCLLAAIGLLATRDLRWREFCIGGAASIVPKQFDVRPRLLLFACWSAFFGGLTVPAQNYFPRFVLELNWLAPLALLGATYFGQALASAWLGRLCDRLGSVTVILIAQVMVAVAPLCFLFATPESPWWIGGSAALQVAQVGILLGVTCLMLRSTNAAERIRYVPLVLAAIAICTAAGSFCGELMLEALSYHHFQVAVGELTDYGYLFYIGAVTRLLGIVLLFGWKEEGRLSLGDWLRATKRRWFPPEELSVPARHPLD